MKLSHGFSGALRTFVYFMASGTHYMLEDVDYLRLYGEEPSAIEMIFAIFANVIELSETGKVLNFTEAQERATDYLQAYCDSSYEVSPPFEVWETTLYPMPRQSRSVQMSLEEWKLALEKAILVKLAEIDANRILKILDVGVFPWHALIELSAFYMGDDSDDASEDDVASWPSYNFSHQQEAQWPAVEHLCEAMGIAYSEADETPGSPATVAAMYFQAAADVMQRPAIAEALNMKQLADDFRITVLDPDDSDHDYMPGYPRLANEGVSRIRVHLWAIAPIDQGLLANA